MRPQRPTMRRQLVALVADDEPAVRRLVCSILAKHGWRTIEAGSGMEALGYIGDVRIDLLIADYEMPGYSGLDLAYVVRVRSPGVRIVIMSGHRPIGFVVEQRGHRFLAKPFTPDEFMDEISDAMDDVLPGESDQEEMDG